ncbi:MAG: amino acid adenylation domain-containing protein [Desulfobacteraceae bacterium]|nr:MAG: amino acid adenylation domain-containing protein [Desulfobacteraceae bacterium]
MTQTLLRLYDLPIDIKNAACGAADWKRYTFALPAPALKKIESLIAASSSNLYAVGLSSFMILLHRLTGMETVTVNCGGEIRKEGGGSASEFIITIDRNRAFQDFLSSLQVKMAGEASSLSPIASSEAEGDSLFSLSYDCLRAPALPAEAAFHRPPEQADLSLKIFQLPEGIQVSFSYDGNRIRNTTIERWATYFARILETVSENPAVPIGEIPILSEGERHRLVFGFNSASVDCRVVHTIHAVFQNQARKTPDYTALEYHDRKMTYAELEKRSNQVARVLRARGVGPDTIVGVFMERSMAMIYGILGILKAGGAYLPISPTFPEERIKYLLEDSEAKIVLTRGPLSGRIPSPHRTLSIESDEVSMEKDQPLEEIATPDDLAYVIYTSGSTGAPKAVMQCHKTVVASFSNLAGVYPMERDDAFLFRTIFTFDPSVAELFFWFFGCGKAVIADDGDEKQPDRIVAHIYNHRVTHLVAVPSLLNAFMESLDDSAREKLNSLKYVFVLGEAVTPALVKRFYATFKTAAMKNIYGPTETLLATNFHIGRELMDADIVPVGKPISSVRIYILNRYMELVPIGVPGEIYIGGENVARGYLHQEELTRRRFLEDPFRPGKQMYKSGDLGRWLEDGNIDFIGRIDFQVKVSGVRIELGEIENQLLSLPAVKEAGVLALKDKQTGDKFLCAYIALHDPQYPIPELKKALAEKIPSYMVPSYFVKLPAIPLTTNGKLDRANLPWPTVSDLHVDYQPPRNEVEKRLVSAWQKVLGVDEIGIRHNFFDLGGNSLKAIRLVTRLKTDFQIGINHIFEFPTIAALAEKIVPKREKLADRIEGLVRSRNMYACRPAELFPEHPELNNAYEAYLAGISECEALDLEARTAYENIFLTGGTGYLGAYLLRDLLKTKSSHVFLPVRGKNHSEASLRIRNQMAYYFGEDFFDRHRDRITVVQADLTQPRLGMAQRDFERLASRIDCIINSAANVKHYGHYSQFHEINVESVDRLLDFAGLDRKKEIHQLSTIGVSIGSVPGKPLLLFTEEDTDAGQRIENHYVNTKLAAEKRILEARGQGVTANIYRIGDIVFDSETGAFQKNIDDNAFYSLVRSFIKLGRIPETETHHDFAFVDFVSRAVTALFDRAKLRNQTFHIFNHHRTDLAARLSNVRLELDLQVMDLAGFLGYIIENKDTPELAEYIQDILLHYGLLDEEITTGAWVLAERTNRILARLGFEWKAVSEAQIAKMIAHGRKVGFF